MHRSDVEEGEMYKKVYKNYMHDEWTSPYVE